MKAYKIYSDDYSDIWLKLEEVVGRRFDYPVVDRWLSIFHGITATSSEVDEDECYPFVIRDEKKFMLSLLKYGDEFLKNTR